jgi:hypothetical protein
LSEVAESATPRRDAQIQHVRDLGQVRDHGVIAWLLVKVLILFARSCAYFIPFHETAYDAHRAVAESQQLNGVLRP